jgi:hypothetical protein
MQTEYILHLDMDGVLSDFDTAFEKISGGLSSAQYKASGKRPPDLYLSKGPEFWVNMDWIDGGKELLDFCLSNFKLVRILSSAGTGKNWVKYKEVVAGKTAWLATHAPQIDKKNIIIVPFHTLKARHAGPDRILVDDHDVNINAWNEAGGIGVLHHSENWQSTVTTLQRYSNGPIKLKEIVGLRR